MSSSQPSSAGRVTPESDDSPSPLPIDEYEEFYGPKPSWCVRPRRAFRKAAANLAKTALDRANGDKIAGAGELVRLLQQKELAEAFCGVYRS